MRRFLLLLRSNWISATGAVITTVAFMVFVTTLIYLGRHGSSHGAYMGLFAFVALPGLFLFGLGLIPLGLFVYRRQLAARMDLLKQKPFHLLRVVALLTVVNIAVAGTGGYEAVHYMDSQQFCGTVCHTVMSPAYTTSLDSPHANVNCVECHIAPGAGGFVKAKVSGLRQLLAMVTGNWSRPIPTPVHGMASPQETCQKCHAASHAARERLVVRRHYDEDEAVSAATSVFVMKTGDGSHPAGAHWHLRSDHKIEFVATDRRTKVPWIRYTDAAGKQRIFTAEDIDPKAPPAGELRAMDCIDCHNQPGHHQQVPGAALDAAISAGRVSPRLPFIKKVGLEALQQPWTTEQAPTGIRAHLETFYAGMPALSADARAAIAPAAEALVAIWRRNVQPEGNVVWGTYPKFDAHLGCMRCHDGEHMDETGEAITMECSKCHTMLADKSKDPDILQKLGLGGGNAGK